VHEASPQNVSPLIPPAAAAAVGEVEQDEKAQKESAALQTGVDLEKKAEENQHSRRESARDKISTWLGRWIAVVAFLVICATLVMAWHMIMPSCLRWLDPQEIASIKDTLTSVTIGVVFGFLAKSKFL